ncbi:MAG: DNA internalization-related competence protein ComEC/Rec2 [Oscillospiraceae bacterium]
MRKLLSCAVGYTAALVLSHYLLPAGWLYILAGAMALAGLCALFLKNRARTIAMLLTFSAAAGFFWTAAFDDLFIQPADSFAGSTLTVSARVLDYPEDKDGYTTLNVRLTEADMPRCRVLLYDYGTDFDGLRPGDRIRVTAAFITAREFYKEESDRYTSEGIFLRGRVTGDCEKTGRWALAFLCFPKELARAVKEQADACFPADVAPLMKALLTGDKSDYYRQDSLSTAMSVAGLSHIVAVSGMHVAFILSVLSLATGRRRRTAFIGIPLIVVFMAMVGFTPSVVRAGIMQILLLIAPLLRRENDAPTSLSAALLLLLILNPEAVGSVSLQLSFAAMAGILLVSPRVYDALTRKQDGSYRFKDKWWAKPLRALCTLFASSVGAIVFTTPLVSLHFGFVPLYSLLTNLLCVWAMTGAFVLGYAVCLLGMLSAPLGGALGWLVAWLPRYTAAVVTRIARLPWAALYTANNLAAWWLVFAYAVFLVSWLCRGKGGFRPVIPICACVSTLCLVTMLTSLGRGDESLSVTAIDVGQGQSIAILTENGTALIDCGGMGTPQNAGDAAAEYLLSDGRERVDVLLLTHLHTDHANGVERLMSRMEVERLVLPADCEDDEELEDILSACQAQGTEVWYISENTDITMDGLRLTVYAPLGGEDENERGLIIYGDYGDFEFLVTGDAGQAVEELFLALYDPGDIELLVVGHHGSKYSTCEAFLDAVTPELAFISVGSANSYGHPTPETLARLEEREIEVLRTDQSGNITVTVGEENG